jgi:subfamily B ATP-binding cassette protein HlyB/CyaB
MIARLHHVAAEPAHLAHRLGWTPSHISDADDLPLAARQLGLKAKRCVSDRERLKLVPLPALAFLGDGRLVLLAHCDGQRVLFFDAAPGAEGQSSRPTIEPIEVFASQWTGELILITGRASLAGELAKFAGSFRASSSTATESPAREHWLEEREA